MNMIYLTSPLYHKALDIIAIFILDETKIDKIDHFHFPKTWFNTNKNIRFIAMYIARGPQVRKGSNALKITEYLL